MLGKTNIIYVERDQESGMQFVKEYMQTKSSSHISRVRYYNGVLFAFTGDGAEKGKYVLGGSDPGKMDYLKYNGAMIDVTDVQFFDGTYIFYNRNKSFEWDKENKTITLEYYAGADLLQLEKRSLAYTVNKAGWPDYATTYGSIIGVETSSDGSLVFLLFIHGEVSTDKKATMWYVMEIMGDMDTMQREIVTEEKNFYVGDHLGVRFMRDRFWGLNRWNETCYILTLDGMITQQNGTLSPDAIIDDIAYYIVEGKIYYSINFTSRLLLWSSGQAADTIFPIRDRIAVYRKNSIVSSSTLLLADSFNDIKDNKMTSIVIGALSDYTIMGWAEAGEYTYLGGPDGIIVKCFLDMDGSYQRPEIALVKTLAAKEALAEANKYTDEKLAELKAYVDSKFQ